MIPSRLLRLALKTNRSTRRPLLARWQCTTPVTILRLWSRAPRRYARWLTLLDNATKQRLYTPEFAQRMAALDSVQWLVEAQQACDSADPLDRLLFADNTTYLPDDLLVKVDIAAMQHSLEP